MRTLRRLPLALVALAAIAAIAGCGGTATTSGSPGSSVAGATGPAADDLTGKTWQLTVFTEKVPPINGVVTPEDRAKYTIFFNPNHTFNLTADCNRLVGTYRTPLVKQLTIDPGLRTVGFCGRGSFGHLFVHAIEQAKRYDVEGDRLTITETSDGTMTFVVAPPEPSPSGSSTGAPAGPTATPVPTATAVPTAKPTPVPTAKPTPVPTAKPTAVPTAKPTATPTSKPTSGATAKPTAEPTATASSASPAPAASGSAGTVNGLLGRTWQVTGMTTKYPIFSGELPEDQQPNYTIEFLPDGSFQAKADCNGVSGAYTSPTPTATSGELTITPGPTTMAMCAVGSYSDLYVLALSLAVSYAIDESGVLTITLDGGGALTLK